MSTEELDFATDLDMPESFHWEICVAEEGKEEAAILEKKEICKKCQNGEKYVAWKDLTIDLLPASCRNETAWWYIHHVAELTVKITIIYRQRKNSKVKKSLNGTGFVVALNRVAGDGELNNDPSSNHKTEIAIFTAEHVIQSNLVEKIDIFFNYNDEKDASKQLIVLKGGNVTTDLQKDFCQLSCFSSDLEFVNLLDHHLQSVKEISKESLSSIRFSFIVSHPHGWEKMVSFGSWWQQNYDHDDQSYPLKLARLGDSIYGVYKKTVLYNIPTCIGSSGARVMLFGYKDYEYTYHLGSLSDDIGISSYSLKTLVMQELMRESVQLGVKSSLPSAP